MLRTFLQERIAPTVLRYLATALSKKKKMEVDEESVVVSVVTAGGASFVVRATLGWSVARLREVVAREVGAAATVGRVRLLHGGRAMRDEATLGMALVQRQAGKATVHVAVGGEERAARVEHEHEEEEERTIGFDRLQEAGFSEADVAELRAQFAALRGGEGASREEEERWLAEETAAGVAAATAEQTGGEEAGKNERMFVAMMVGFVFPPALWLVPERMLTRHSRFGLVVGLMANVVPFAIYSIISAYT